MAQLNLDSMRSYLSSSISSINQNKINGMLAEIDLRNTLNTMGFGSRLSQGGWIVRNVGAGIFGHQSSVLFPMIIQADTDYSPTRVLEEPPIALHTICSTMHQIGVHSFYCVPSVTTNNNTASISWQSKQLGIPNPVPFTPMLTTVQNFGSRTRNYNFLRYRTNAAIVPETSVAEEFTKENLRVAFQNAFMCEMSDIDGIIWGQQYTYPIEIKEKTVANDTKVGNYFGIDVGPFVKLAFYAAKKGNLHSLFFVREINNTTDRQLVNWWFITFDTLAQYASWVSQGGGRNMQGGGSTVVKIPKAEFTALTSASLATL